MNVIVLIGMMGSGKTSVGIELANRLGWTFIDTDAAIEAMQGMSIPSIFECFGEQFFRTLERSLISSLESTKNVVISTGGGMVVSADNASKLKSMGRIIYLKGSLEQLSKNISQDFQKRPMLTTHSMASLLAQRTPIYEALADYFIEIDGRKIESLVLEIQSYGGWDENFND